MYQQCYLISPLRSQLSVHCPHAYDYSSNVTHQLQCYSISKENCEFSRKLPPYVYELSSDISKENTKSNNHKSNMGSEMGEAASLKFLTTYLHDNDKSAVIYLNNEKLRKRSTLRKLLPRLFCLNYILGWLKA